jgi:penicillin-binding protein 2
MLRVHSRKILQGDTANISIGQGDVLVTPLQMAQAMGVLAARGSFHQTRLVKQVQSLDNKIVAAYPDRIRAELNIAEENLDDLNKGLVMVTTHGTGTGRRAATVRGVKVAGKTGTAQWGPVRKRRNAAWFAGYAPANHPPLYAFAAVVESNPGESISAGTYAAPVIGNLLATLFKGYKPPAKGEKKDEEPAEETAVETEDMPDAEIGEDITLSLDTPVELTELTTDLMNPEGAPTFDEPASMTPTPAPPSFE